MNHTAVAYETIKIDTDVDMRYSCCTDYGYFVPMHWHDSIEVLYILDGETTVNIDQQLFTLHQNEYIILDSKVIHSTSCKTFSHFLIIQIPYRFLKTYIPDIDYIHFQNICSVPASFSDRESSNCVIPEVSILEELRSILEQLVLLWNTKPQGYPLKYYSYIFDLLYIMNTHFKTEISQSEYHQSEKYMERLTSVMSYVKQHYTEAVSLQDISDYLALNPAYFTRFFKKYMGMTFTEYLNSIRLRHIYEDVLSTDLPIQTILEKNGFTNYKLFMRMFRETYGGTPSQKRKDFHTHML